METSDPYQPLALLNTLAPFALYGIGVVIATLLLVAIYRLTGHPLAKYPGPLSYKVSGWPLVYQCYKGNRHLRHLRDHDKYGPVVRVSPNSLSFSSPTALHQIYGSRSVNVRKSKFYEVLDSGPGGATTHTEIDKEKHAARRRILSQAFSEAALKEIENFVIQNVSKFIKMLGQGSCAGEQPLSDHSEPKQANNDAGWSEEKNMSQWCNWLAYDIMGNIVFGKCYDCLESEEHRRIPTVMTEGTKFGYWFAYLPFGRLLPFIATTSFVQWLAGPTAQDNATLVSYAISQFEERAAIEKVRRENGEDAVQKDIMYYLLNNADRKNGIRLTVEELKGDALSLIGAGADTVATTLSAVLFYLLRNPSSLHRAQAEVRAAFESLEEIRMGPKLDSCIYLTACIEEALRLAPPVASLLPREVMKGGIVIDGHYVPEGVVVGVPAYVTHHDEKAFPEPWKFLPERWIVGSSFAGNNTCVSKEDVERAREAMCPFSLGSRGCIGKPVAYMEMRITLASLLCCFDIQEVVSRKGDKTGQSWIGKDRIRADEYQLFDCFGADRDGPIVRIRKRARERGVSEGK